ncbi:hypothetical protein ONR57_12305, partial [Hoyosella sp. YIM 151337]|uniref:hypothetical protein n=1 Tax=Hoyosella sp. YIM 151337 TaxID=2992742 RepID=UPI0022362483
MTRREAIDASIAALQPAKDIKLLAQAGISALSSCDADEGTVFSASVWHEAIDAATLAPLDAVQAEEVRAEVHRIIRAREHALDQLHVRWPHDPELRALAIRAITEVDRGNVTIEQLAAVRHAAQRAEAEAFAALAGGLIARSARCSELELSRQAGITRTTLRR